MAPLVAMEEEAGAADEPPVAAALFVDGLPPIAVVGVRVAMLIVVLRGIAVPEG